MQLLQCLAEHAGQVISVEELLDRVWAGIVVTPDSVYHAVASLRRLLGDDTKEPTYIVNIPRRGYRLVAPVAPWVDAPNVTIQNSLKSSVGSAQAILTVARTGSPWLRPAIVLSIVLIVALGYVVVDRFRLSKSVKLQNPATATTTAPSDKSIAVLPFTDMSESKDQEYFADGMAEEIIDLLARIPSLTVIGRTSSFHFKGANEDLRIVGKELNVGYVVEGSIRKAGSRIRVTAQLIDTRSGTHRWSESYDRDFGDVLALQSQIATSIARALQLAVGADDTRPPRLLHSMEAYTLYLRGRAAYDGPRDIPEAQSDYEQALALDPSFLRAAEGLAWMYAYAAVTQEMQSRIAWQYAKDAAEKALLIDEDSAPAHAVLGLMHAEYEYDWDIADAELSKALTLSPRDPVSLDFAARLACHRGRYEEALRRIDASLSVDPLNPRTHRRKGFILYLAGDDHGAEREFRRSLEIFPTFDWDHNMLTWILVARGELQAALKESQAEPAVGGKDQGLAIVYHALGRNAESDMALTRLINEFPDWPTGAAIIYGYRAEADRAFEWLDRAYTIRDPDLTMWIRSPFFAWLRNDPRYKALLRKMNLSVRDEVAD
jgi:TolB-like protein